MALEKIIDAQPFPKKLLLPMDNFIPWLIQEILDFKAWVKGFFKDGLEILVGQYGHAFVSIFVNSIGCLWCSESVHYWCVMEP